VFIKISEVTIAQYVVGVIVMGDFFRLEFNHLSTLLQFFSFILLFVTRLHFHIHHFTSRRMIVVDRHALTETSRMTGSYYSSTNSKNCHYTTNSHEVQHLELSTWTYAFCYKLSLFL